jgi:hypothetical protein
VSKEIMLRFYVAMMLYDLFKNKSFYDVAKFWDQSRGTIQTLYSQVASFATSMLYFSKVSLDNSMLIFIWFFIL